MAPGWALTECAVAVAGTTPTGTAVCRTVAAAAQRTRMTTKGCALPYSFLSRTRVNMVLAVFWMTNGRYKANPAT